MGRKESNQTNKIHVKIANMEEPGSEGIKKISCSTEHRISTAHKN